MYVENIGQSSKFIQNSWLVCIVFLLTFKPLIGITLRHFVFGCGGRERGGGGAICNYTEVLHPVKIQAFVAFLFVLSLCCEHK